MAPPEIGRRRASLARSVKRRRLRRRCPTPWLATTLFAGSRGLDSPLRGAYVARTLGRVTSRKRCLKFRRAARALCRVRRGALLVEALVEGR